MNALCYHSHRWRHPAERSVQRTRKSARLRWRRDRRSPAKPRRFRRSTPL